MDALTMALFGVGIVLVLVAVVGLAARRRDIAPARPRRVSAWLVYPFVLVTATLGAWWSDWRGPRPPD
jgi:hypothetical protein